MCRFKWYTVKAKRTLAGMWIAGLLFLVMMIQSVFFRTPAPSTIPVTETADQVLKANKTLSTPQ